MIPETKSDDTRAASVEATHSLPDPDLGMSQISSSSGNLTQKFGTLMRCAKFGEFRKWTSLFPHGQLPDLTGVKES